MPSESVTAFAPDLIRVRAPNPSPMTYTGTNTYLIGRTDVVVIDPGPNLPEHLHAILEALPLGARITHILVTHAHSDHAGLCSALAEATGAPVLAAGPPEFGRSPLMQALAAKGGLGGGEGVETGFLPDKTLAHGDAVLLDNMQIDVLATPGHMANHLSFAWRDILFSGDLVMGWSTSLVSPPDGDMTSFMASLAMLQTRNERIYHPGHGEPVLAPQERVAELIAHRQSREAQITRALAEIGPATASDLAHAIYTDTPAALLPAAARNVLAHLIDLKQKSRVEHSEPFSENSFFTLKA
ncbi:MAG: MBL fold metallo-hydrolase [Pseudomonadota bacterium]